jgi:hypothetical protein
MGDMIFPTMSTACLARTWAGCAGVSVRYHRRGIAAFALEFDSERDRARFVKVAREILATLPEAAALDQIREAIER